MKNAVIMINSFGMGNPGDINRGIPGEPIRTVPASFREGKADLPLQHTLMGKYLELLLQGNKLPAAICFYTEGVKLVTEGSPVLAQLKSLEEKGVRLIVCSTCLNYFNLADKVKIGIVGGMTDIIEAQTKAEKVITL